MNKVNNTILIIDDDPVYLRVTEKFLCDKNFKVFTAANGEKGISAIKDNNFDIILIDKNLPDIAGLDILKNHIPENLDSIIIMVTAEPSIKSAVEAIQAGANNYITKPCNNDELLFKINKELEIRKLKTNIHQLQSTLEDHFSFKHIVGECAEIKKIHETIHQIKDSDITILITGETGTGKGMLAEATHYISPRKNKPFVTINAGTLAENVLESELFGHVKGAFTGAYKDKTGLFQTAEGGTVFIDEIGDMPLKMQIKLLRVLQNKEFEPVGSTKTIKTDVRIISATNKPLKELVESHEFREDLYYRLNIMHFEIPPLRKRKDDVIHLANHFIKLFTEKNKSPMKSLSSEAAKALSMHNWPGNIRELENCIQRMILLEKGEVLSLEHLPEEIKDSLSRDTLLEDSNQMIPDDFPEHPLSSIVEDYTGLIEKRYLKQFLTKYKGHISKVAEVAGLDRKTIYRKMQKFGLQKEQFS